MGRARRARTKASQKAREKLPLSSKARSRHLMRIATSKKGQLRRKPKLFLHQMRLVTTEFFRHICLDPQKKFEEIAYNSLPFDKTSLGLDKFVGTWCIVLKCIFFISFV